MATREFKFGKKELELIFEGNSFFVNVFDENITKLQAAFAEKAEEISKNITNITEDMVVSADLCKQFIDDILGVGAVETIFKGRKIDFYDLFDVVNYINDEIRTEREKKAKVYTKNPKYNTHPHRKHKRKK